MNFDEINRFLEKTSDRLENTWQISNLSNIAQTRIPDFITGNQDVILRADITTLWTQWFLESICDPERFIENYPGYAHVVHSVKNEIPFLFSNIPIAKHGEIIRQISKLLDGEIKRRHIQHRVTFDSRIKNMLLDIYGSEPRCWICGYKFSTWAMKKFSGQITSEEVPQPQFIDYLMPRGLNSRDLQIEIDHVFPFSEGGEEDIENLRLACGWCNVHKSNRLSLYDVASKPGIIHHPNLGRVTVPHPFWNVRLLSLHRQCQHEGGCDRTVDNAELTITSRHPKGSMNPMNLRVTCIEHDNIGSNRFIAKTAAEHLFKKVQP